MIDVLIIGSGGAGLTAALSAKEKGLKVLIVSKTYPTHSQTCQAQGGINAILNNTESDNIDNFINDTYKASHKLGNIDNIKFMCENSKKTITWLDSIAVPFSRNKNNQIAQRKFGGTKAKRTCYSSDYTGLKILHTLYDQCIKENIDFLHEHYLLSLIVEDNKVKGITALDILDSNVKEIHSKCVILASGGYAGLYHNYTTNSYSTTGDGVAAALKAGAKISNMEFVQFHPTALENKNILISESARGEGGYLVDTDGNRFIDELKPRDEVARAIYEKNQKGEKVYLDLRHLGKERIKEIMPQERGLIYDFTKLKIENDLIPVNPSSHYTMGGILTNKEAETSIENLFACGECSQSGIHGANRLGGNSLLEIITFAKIAAKNVAKRVKELDLYVKPSKKQFNKDKKKIELIFEKTEKIDFYKTKKDLGKLLFNNLGLFREEKEIKKAIKYIKIKKEEIAFYGIKDKSKVYNKNLLDLLELENIITLCEAIAKSSFLRKESRGAHFRSDFKEEKEDFCKNSICILKNDKLEFSFEDIK